ncbi:MAG: hypothetical protein QM527_14730 [Alphaproteobacteria bacterium]|nr:hypothetical protein [Alphaproteobacteria bacterium]
MSHFICKNERLKPNLSTDSRFGGGYAECPWANGSSELKTQYDAFVADMVYGPPASTPSFGEALVIFSRTLRITLAKIKPENIANEMARSLSLEE